jgi:hypothetical protein
MIKKNLLVGCLLLILFLSACSQTETSNSNTTPATTPVASNDAKAGQTTAKSPPADVVRVEAPGVEIKSGGSAEASLKLTIADGYHINANPPSFSYLKATSLELEESGGVSPGTPVYPASVTRKFAFSKDPLAVYEGEAIIKQPLRADNTARPGTIKLKAELRIQACDEEACYPPRTIETSIPVTIK